MPGVSWLPSLVRAAPRDRYWCPAPGVSCPPSLVRAVRRDRHSCPAPGTSCSPSLVRAVRRHRYWCPAPGVSCSPSLVWVTRRERHSRRTPGHVPLTPTRPHPRREPPPPHTRRSRIPGSTPSRRPQPPHLTPPSPQPRRACHPRGPREGAPAPGDRKDAGMGIRTLHRRTAQVQAADAAAAQGAPRPPVPALSVGASTARIPADLAMAVQHTAAGIRRRLTFRDDTAVDPENKPDIRRDPPSPPPAPRSGGSGPTWAAATWTSSSPGSRGHAPRTP